MEAPKEAGIFERSNSRLVRDDVEGAGLQNEEEEDEAPLMPLWMSIALYVATHYVNDLEFHTNSYL